MEKKNMDDFASINTNETTWLVLLDHCPRTVGQFKLLVSIVDRMGVFIPFDLQKTTQMDGQKLDIIYIILRITNKIFNKFSEHVVKKIFKEKFKQLFNWEYNMVNHYELFMDQLVQDLDHFILIVMKTYYPVLDVDIIKMRFINYLKSTFSNPFYTKQMEKLLFRVGDSFFVNNDQFFGKMVNEFISFTHETILQTYKTMKLFLKKIFDDHCSQETVDRIINCLEKYFTLEELFSEHCMELDIYCEEMLEDSIDLVDKLSTDQLQSNLDVVSDLDIVSEIKNFGYQIYEDEDGIQSGAFWKPFVDHKLAKSQNDLLEIVYQIMTEYENKPGLINDDPAMTLEDFYRLTTDSHESYSDFCNKKCYHTNLELIWRVLSRVFNTKIEILNSDWYLMEIDNTLEINAPTIMVYQKKLSVYTIYPIGIPFEPLNDRTAMLKSFAQIMPTTSAKIEIYEI